ncbi:HAD-IC family P-type ATPase [Saccharopolyspora sp. ASAGF58]|uniref:HAD-IC family P-type ATPase n=1 Tax=Saccharopolyspora sp. ASAGF58 TaxID=2719023 RepID=UPI0014402623|nr:HAD-IC family P-type ATPase [Saccharopolyspora sp. ASAGF58]QIZ37654.1 cation-translocating P-type ATPase [Saccharopolyspora sp. ASAGF58]
MLRTLGALASQIVAPVAAAARSIAGLESGRRAWASDGRAHVEVRGVHQPGSEDAGERVVRRLEKVPGVAWVEINAAVGRVVIGHDPDLVGIAGLVGAVEDAEAETGLDGEPFATVSADHPDNPVKVFAEVAMLGANLAGAAITMGAELLPLPALPPSVPALVSTGESASRVRGPLETRLGKTATDVLFGIGSAVANTLAQRRSSLLAESAYRFFLLRETQAAQRSWARWEAGVGRHPASHRSKPVAVVARPVPLPDGPVERAANGSALAGPAAFAGMLGVTRSFQRAQAMLVAGAPRAALVGRGAFAAQLGYGLSERTTLVFEPRVLRRLDRVDTVVIDAGVVRTGVRLVHDVIPAEGDHAAVELWERAHHLVGVTKADGTRREGWSLSSVARSRLPSDVRGAAGPGIEVFALRHDSRRVAWVLAAEELDPLAEELVAAARGVGSVVVAGDGGRLAARIGVDRVVAGGVRLASVVREMQREGSVVAVVSSQARAALAAADVGFGVTRDGVVPWGAHLIAGASLGEPCALLRNVSTARQVSRRSAQLSLIGSVGGAALAAFGPAIGSQARAGIPVAVCAAIALGAGTWWGMQAAWRPVPRAVPRTAWHAMAPGTVLELLDSSPEGLTDDSARQRFPDHDEGADFRRMGVLRASLEELASPLTPALAGGAAISASIGAVADATIILGVLGMNALIGGVQRITADRALNKLLAASVVRVVVRRKENVTQLPADQLVLGDVVELVAGDAVPADCRLLEADGLELDESSLTGESMLVTKTVTATPAVPVADRTCMIYRGTAVAAGRGVGVVVATGADTEAGSAIGPEVRRGADGVAARLQTLAKVTVPICLGAGGILLVTDILRGRRLGTSLGRAVSLAVAAVPEGLPFVATVAELAAARRLSKRGALVRNSATIEALGRAQVLCFDKTGTLTEGRIALRRVSDGASSRWLENISTVQRRVLAGALRASPLVDNGELLPHPTDRAVVDGARGAGVHPAEGKQGWVPIDEMPFEPSRGYHAVLGTFSDGNLLSVKGAPEIVLAQCTRWRRPDGDVPLEGTAGRDVERVAENLARQGYRVLAVAERAASDRSDLDESRIRDLRLIGFVALADPVRPTAAAAVAQLQQAGVEVVMVTGDHPSTAEAIAAELNALNERRVMTGTELDTLDDDQLAAEVATVAVFARVSPAQKARIVDALQRNDRVVAVTGDGANDAPAIRLADIGIALGQRATPAAREAADLVVTDDRIETIVDAIVEGRAMWASVRDSLAILLGGNLGEIGFTVVTGLINGGGSLNARQLLLVNLLTDILPAMAIAVRPPPTITAEMLLAEGPEASLGAALTHDIYRRAAVTAGAAICAWILGRATGSLRQANTVALVALVAAQLGQTLVVRGRTPLVVGCALVSFVALAAVVQTPGLSQFFGSSPLLPHGWMIAAGMATAATAISLLLQQW